MPFGPSLQQDLEPALKFGLTHLGQVDADHGPLFGRLQLPPRQNRVQELESDGARHEGDFAAPYRHIETTVAPWLTTRLALTVADQLLCPEQDLKQSVRVDQPGE